MRKKITHFIKSRLNKNEPRASSSNPAHTYPSETEIANRVASIHKIVTDNLLLSCAGDQGLDIVIRSKAKGGGKVITLDPDFIRYKHWIEANELEPKYVNVCGFNPTFPAEEIFAAYDTTVKILIVSTVGNPMSYLLPKGFIEEFHQRFPDVLILIDEVYSNFTGDDYSAFAVKNDNVVSLRSLSKLGAPGIRFGYLIGKQETIQPMRKYSLAHPLAGPCYEEAMKILNSAKPLDKLVREQVVAREWFITELGKRTFTFHDSRANWVQIHLGDVAEQFVGTLKKNGIEVFLHRHPRLVGWIRVSTPNIKSLKPFINELDKL